MVRQNVYLDRKSKVKHHKNVVGSIMTYAFETKRETKSILK